MSASVRPLRTGIVPRTPFASLDGWRARVRAIDEQGHDVLLVADHVGMVAPLPPLVAAAGTSERLRFGVQVLNNEFWNPVLLAREAATADILTAGRLELGFGAGHAAVEFAAAGIAYDRPAPAHRPARGGGAGRAHADRRAGPSTSTPPTAWRRRRSGSPPPSPSFLS